MAEGFDADPKVTNSLGRKANSFYGKRLPRSKTIEVEIHDALEYSKYIKGQLPSSKELGHCKSSYPWIPEDWKNYLLRCSETSGIEYFPLPEISKKEYEGIQIEIFVFIQTLIFYEFNVKDKFMSAEEIFFRSFEEGPAFAEYLADFHKYSLRSTYGLTEMSWKPGYIDIEGTIDYIFPAKCLMSWKIPDPKDWSYYFDESAKITEDALDEFEGIFRSLVSNKELLEPDILDDLRWLRNTSILRADEKSGINYLEEANYIGPRYTDVFIARCDVIQKNPAETRPVLIMDTPTMHTMSDCSRYLAQIGKTIPEYAVHRVNKFYEKEMRHLTEKNIY